jgi:hypothetical protein
MWARTSGAVSGRDKSSASRRTSGRGAASLRQCLVDHGREATMSTEELEKLFLSLA